MASPDKIFGSIEALHTLIFLAGTKPISLKAIFQYDPKKKNQNLLALEANQIQIWQSSSRKKIQRPYKALIMAKL